MSNIFPIDFEEKLTMAQDDYILFSDSEDGNKIKKAQYKNLKGEPGTPGTPGTPGKDGKDGTDGAAATITVGSTTTGAAGSSASVTNSGTSSAAILDFTIPQGAKGEPGEDGQDGADGAAATITVGTTTTLPAGSSATVTNVGTSQDAILNFGIPKGDAGTGSGDVNGPASSTDGDVALFDGATGKLIKDSGASLADYQEKLTAGTNIQISNNVISATGGSDIVYATQAEYNALLPGAESDGKHYFIYSTSGGGGWQPGVNTLLYLPLETDFDDYSQNHLSITNSGPVGLVSTGTGASIPVASFNSLQTQLSFTNSYDMNNTWTLNVWANITAQSTDALLLIAGTWSPMRIFHIGFTPSASRGLTVSNSSVDVDSGSFDGRDGTWHLISITYSGTSGGSNNVKMYIDGVFNAQGTSTGRNLNTTTFMIGNYNQTATFGGYMSKFMLESTEWSAQDLADFYDQTKANYGIS